MKKLLLAIFLFCMIGWAEPATAQCSICTKTVQQLGEKPAKALNGGILYLAFAPFAIVGFVAYKWMKNYRNAS